LTFKRNPEEWGEKSNLGFDNGSDVEIEEHWARSTEKITDGPSKRCFKIRRRTPTPIGKGEKNFVADDRGKKRH